MKVISMLVLSYVMAVLFQRSSLMDTRLSTCSTSSRQERMRSKRGPSRQVFRISCVHCDHHIAAQKGTKAPQAAGKIHTDFENGFIMAEVGVAPPELF